MEAFSNLNGSARGSRLTAIGHKISRGTWVAVNGKKNKIARGSRLAAYNVT